MKWIMLIAIILSSTACVYSSTEVIEHREVIVAPVTETVMFDYDNTAPMDMTLTTLDFY